MTRENNSQYFANSFDSNIDLICFSHLRWDFVFQRPQHLMGRAVQERRVFVIEEPVFGEDDAHLSVTERQQNLFVVVPHLRDGIDNEGITRSLRDLIDLLIIENDIQEFVAWYYTPMMLKWSRHLTPQATVYDCMDELSAFKNAPEELGVLERELFVRADVVFTGGQSLYDAKKDQHSNIFAFPSSIDVDHFSKAPGILEEMPDQEAIPFPRVGFVGVIDERLDIDLLGQIADLRPELQFVMIGPVVKIDQNDLPRRTNIHYLGGKQYSELPEYLSGWQVAMMPFAINESTRFISPTKTPEYLAAGLPVVSTPIRDVANPYGEEGLVYIAATAEEFSDAIESALNQDLADHNRRASEFLSDLSWDKTYTGMSDLIGRAIGDRDQEAEETADALGTTTSEFSN